MERIYRSMFLMTSHGYLKNKILCLKYSVKEKKVIIHTIDLHIYE